MKSKLYFGILIFPQLFTFFLNTNAQSPGWLWAKSIGGTGDDYAYSVALDPDGSGDVYTTGSFGGTVDFDPGPGIFNLTGGGIFISKLNGSGEFVWAKAMSGYGGGYSISIDPAGGGSVYTTGYFLGTVDFDPGEGEFNLTAQGQDIFISKLDESGNFIWAKAMGGTNGISGYSLAIAPSGGGVFTTGNFTGTVDFDPGPGTYNVTSAGVGDIFISKLDLSGNFLWAKGLAGTEHDNAHSIVTDAAGNVYVTGFFRGTIDFDPGPGTYNLTSAGGSDIFILKLNSSGNFVWARAIGGSPDLDDGYSMAVDPSGSGDIYLTGIFMGTVDFDPGAGAFNLTSSGNYDIFILKLNASGNFEWARSVGSANDDGGRSIIPDPSGSGDVYTSGYFVGTVDFDPGDGEFNLTSNGGYDIFISKLDGSGNFVWAISVGGHSGDIHNSLTLDAYGNMYMAGAFRSDTVSFGSSLLINANSTGYTEDIFIARLAAAPLAVELISFKGSFDKLLKGVNLAWITASEINNDYFMVERSSDGIVFQQIAKIAGAGNSSGIERYKFFDPNPELGINYYRLRQTDYDGKTSYSQIVAVNVEPNTQQISFYPNPAKSELIIEFDKFDIKGVEIGIYNVLGEIVYSEYRQNIDSGHSIDISALAAGIYSIELNFAGNKVMKKVLKQ